MDGTFFLLVLLEEAASWPIKLMNLFCYPLQANRIEIRCDSRNVQSARVAERCGFTLEGILRNDKCDVEGLLRDTMIFSRVRGVEY